MSFSDTTAAAGHWCSRQDCVDIFADLESILDENEVLLNRCIASATMKAQTILRGRWPVDWPFSAVPVEIAQSVAVEAVYRVLRPETFSGGSLEIVGRLQEDATAAYDWLHQIASSEVHLTSGLQGSEMVGRAMSGGAPKGEFGFG